MGFYSGLKVTITPKQEHAGAVDEMRAHLEERLAGIEVNFLLAVDGTGRIHIDAMPPAWPAHPSTETMDDQGVEVPIPTVRLQVEAILDDRGPWYG